MNKTNSNICIIGAFFFIICLFSSCVLDMSKRLYFINYTNDTLLIGTSHYDCIDSVDFMLSPGYLSVESDRDTLWKDDCLYFESSCVIHPDSTCFINYYYLSYKTDTCYFFLIKWSDAKKYSWDEIRDKKMYRTWIVTKDKDGNYDTNIRYLE